MAFMPLVTVNSSGSVSVNSGSYITVRGSTRTSLPVRFKPPSVMPKIGVISEPAYVVGIASIGRPDSSAIALPSPVVDPPPIATAQSAPNRLATTLAS